MNSRSANGRTNSSNGGSGLVAYLFKLQIEVKMFHWQTRSYAAHVGMGELFDKIVALTDELIEQYMGLYGRVRMASNASVAIPNMTKTGIRQTLRDAMPTLDARVPRDSNLQNIKDELTGEMAQALYLLSLR